MSIFEDFCMAVASIELGEIYPFVFGIIITLLVWSFNLLLFAIAPLRKIDKILTLNITLFCISAVASKVFCDIITNKSISEFCIVSSICLLPVIFLGLAISFAFKPSKSELNNHEKQLIDRLLNEDTPAESILNDATLSANPFRRIESLEVKKGFLSESFSDFNLNPSYVESCVCSLLEKDLSLEDRLTANQISKAVQKYKLKNLSNFERDDFSTNLQKLVKLTAKYDNADFDLF